MPKGWRTVSLGEIAEVRMGQQLSPSRRSGARARPYLRAANVGTSGIDLDDVNSMDFSAEEEERYALRPGDILLVEGEMRSQSAARFLCRIWKKASVFRTHSFDAESVI